MVDLYAYLIIRKKKTYSKVPDKYKADVEARLLELGYDTDGNPIKESE